MKGVAIAAVVFLALAAAALQTLRLEGLHLWPIAFDGWVDKAEARQATIDRMIAAQGEAEQRAAAERLAQESKYHAIAERIETDALENLGGALAAADRFIAAGGLRKQAAGHSSGAAAAPGRDRRAADPGRTGPAAQLDGTGAGDAGIAAGLVTISADDVRICTVNTVKAEAGHELAVRLQAASAPAAAKE